MSGFILFWLVASTSVALSALPPGIRGRPYGRAFRDALLFAAGALFPLLVFLASSAPSVLYAKDMCRRGWVDCFPLGKLALAPLVLWACAAFRVAQVLRPEGKPRVWVPLGLFTGVIVSGICFLSVLPYGGRGHCYLPHAGRCSHWWSLVPLYVAAWYSVLCVRAHRSRKPKLLWYLLALVHSVPYLLLSVLLSKKHYMSLPETSDCFVVTAALGGHESLVGPLLAVERGGASRTANRQLLILWRFEAIWRRCAPRSHAIFRRVYNRLGPWVARRIRTRLVADAVYLLLKPVEWVATAVVRCHGRAGN